MSIFYFHDFFILDFHRNYLDFCRKQWKETMQTRKANNLGKVTRAEFVNYVRQFAAEYQTMKQEVNAIKNLSNKEEADIKISCGQQLSVSKEELEHPETTQLQGQTEVSEVPKVKNEVFVEDVPVHPHIIVEESSSVDKQIDSIPSNSSVEYNERIVLRSGNIKCSTVLIKSVTK